MDDTLTVCMPLVTNVPFPEDEKWREATCPVCGCKCWETPMARVAVNNGYKAACTLCALKGVNDANS